MSTLTTINIINSSSKFLKSLPPQPLLRFFGRIQSYDARNGILFIEELPAFMVDFGHGDNPSSPELETQEEQSLPITKVLVPGSGLDLNHDTIQQQLVVSVVGFLQPDLAVTAESVSPLANQHLFDLGYENDKYSSTVLEKIQVIQHIAQY